MQHNDKRFTLTRRHFLSASAGVLAAGLLPTRIVLGNTNDPTPRPRSQALYGVALLGDLHYDQMSHHDFDWVKAEKPGDIRQIEGYVEATNNHMPRLFNQVKQVIHTAPAPVVAVVHIGDFVEGLCGSYDLQARQSRDAIDFVESCKLGVPFIMSKGNHDITGPGADKAFNDVLLPWMAKNAKSQLNSANYTWQQGEDLFIFFDAYKPDMDWLKSRSAQAQQARHVFFVIHPPVVPYNARANWHVFSRDSQKQQREELTKWLGEHNASVLSGHLHRYSNLMRTDTNGSFNQLAVCSVVRNESESPKIMRSGVKDYNSRLLDLEPNFSPKSKEERAAWISTEAPHIKAFDYARIPGYAMLWIYADRVEADVYLGTDEQVWKQPTISV